jgi:hypothetical protein
MLYLALESVREDRRGVLRTRGGRGDESLVRSRSRGGEREGTREEDEEGEEEVERVENGLPTSWWAFKGRRAGEEDGRKRAGLAAPSWHFDLLAGCRER